MSQTLWNYPSPLFIFVILDKNGVNQKKKDLRASHT